MDEAYFKWKTIKSNPNNPPVRGSKGKIKVVRFVNREDFKKVKVFTNNISSLSDVVSLIKQTCVAENTHLMTNAYKIYWKLNKHVKQHSMINNLKQNWTDGEIYTQNIENFWKHTWRLLNTQIRTSHKHFHLYLAEATHRWKNNATFIEFLKEIQTPSSLGKLPTRFFSLVRSFDLQKSETSLEVKAVPWLECIIDLLIQIF